MTMMTTMTMMTMMVSGLPRPHSTHSRGFPDLSFSICPLPDDCQHDEDDENYADDDNVDENDADDADGDNVDEDDDQHHH